MLERINKLTQNYFVKQSIFYLGFYFFCAMFYLVLISLITFFHFMLNHKLSEVQEWILGYGWQLVILAKLSALLCIFQFVDLEGPIPDYYKSLVERKLRIPDWNIWVSIVFTIVFFIWQGQPGRVTHHQFQIIRFILSALGMVVFFVTDLILLIIIQTSYPLDKKTLRWRLIVFSFTFWLINKTIFSYAEDMNILVLGQFILSLFFLKTENSNYLAILTFIILTSGVFVYCGKDPIWGDLFSTMRLKNDLGVSFLFSWLLVLFTHQLFKKSKTYINLKRKMHFLST